MNIESTPLPGVLVLTPSVFADSRGRFSETWNQKTLASMGFNISFVQDNEAYSAKRGTIRALHFQRPPHSQGKLVRAVQGALFDVVVDIRKNSATYGRYFSIELSDINHRQLWVPTGFLHGYATLTDDCIAQYKVDQFFAPEADAGIRWNDPDLNIPWPDFTDGLGPILSAKDQGLPGFKEFVSPF